MSSRRDSLVAEIATVRGLIDMVPHDLVIDRASLESRIAALEMQLRLCEPHLASPRVELYFDGDPVVGARGIESAFAASVINRYSQAVQARAADMRGRLKPDGPLPMRAAHRLYLTERLAGSFGFALEAIPDGMPIEDVEALRAAIDSVDAVIEGSLLGDRQLSESIGSTQPRVLAYVRKFLVMVARARASFRLADQSRAVDARSAAVVEAAANRLRRTQANETVLLRGWLRGILPDNRMFEFEIESDDKTVVQKGGISDEIDSAGIRQIDETCLHQFCEAKFRVTRVGDGTRWVRYLLLEIKVVE